MALAVPAELPGALDHGRDAAVRPVRRAGPLAAQGPREHLLRDPGVTQLAMGAMTEVNSEARARLFCDAGKIEVYKDRAGLERQEALPAVQKTMGLFEELAAAPPELTTFTVSSSEP